MDARHKQSVIPMSIAGKLGEAVMCIKVRTPGHFYWKLEALEGNSYPVIAFLGLVGSQGGVPPFKENGEETTTIVFGIRWGAVVGRQTKWPLKPLGPSNPNMGNPR